ncbi:hypothetical protein SAMN04488518_113149 [Pseudovibrio ascidiaceicola]|uniref:Uncharacterized protein n=1 Tax=Pseudovibrio ascidiaceicola TaxID=285279 RepID=A0A1I4E3L6_9HYPH|nr:hypothetical protein [Pseudovibrio ascidiaceicola]SFK99853.1 hypothetical protein SAMN04488518_113149 [Pseudovibrio ascidiaceicola]
MNAVTDNEERKKLDLADLRANPEKYFGEEGISFEDLEAVIAAENAAFKADLSTEKGRKAIISFSRQCSTLKTAIDGAGKEKVASIKAQATAIDARRKTMRDFLDAMRDERRLPLDNWEAQEKSRIESHRTIIEGMIQNGCVAFNESSADIQKRIDAVRSVDVTEGAMQEFADQASSKKITTLESLDRHLKQALHTEEQQRKLAVLEAEKKAEAAKAEADRKEREAEEEAKLEAEREKTREAEERAEKERIEADKARAAAKAVAEAEAKRKAEDDAKRKADADRAANIEHRKKFNNAALKAIMEAAGIGEDRAKKIVQAIASGAIPHVSIKY